jgi:hypothetical protein
MAANAKAGRALKKMRKQQKKDNKTRASIMSQNKSFEMKTWN